MGLLGNSFQSNFGAGTAWGTTRAFSPGNREKRALFLQSLYSDRQSTILIRLASPMGGNMQSSWQQPKQAGGASMRILNNSTLLASAIPEKTATIDFTGEGELSALASLVISALCDMEGSGTITLDAYGIGNVTVDFEGSGEFAASAHGIANAIIDMIGVGDMSIDAHAIANATIDITVTGTGLTTANVGNAVWRALAAEFDDPDTMGAIMNSIGSGTDPWGTNLPGAYTGDEAGALLLKLLKQIKSLIITK